MSPPLIYNWPLHIVIALAIAGLALSVSLWITMRRSYLIPAPLLKQLEALIDGGEYAQAVDLCESRSGCLCRVVGAGLSAVDAGLDSVLAASRAASKKEFKVLRRGLAWLSRTGILTLLAALAAGLSGVTVPLVLSAAATFLIILAYAFFSMRVVRLASEIESAANGLLTRIRPRG